LKNKTLDVFWGHSVYMFVHRSFATANCRATPDALHSVSTNGTWPDLWCT